MRLADDDPVSSLASRRRFRAVTDELQRRFPDDADLILQASLKKRDAAHLEAMLCWITPRTVLEIGSYCGISTRWLLSALPDQTSRSVECVDPWLPGGTFEAEAIFDAMVSPYHGRVIKTKAYFGSRNNEAFSVPTGRLTGHRVCPGSYDDRIPIFRPTRPYDLVFVDGDHRATSSISAFMLMKEHTSFIVYHDARLASHVAAFDLILKEWAGDWTVIRYDEGEDGLALVARTAAVEAMRTHSAHEAPKEVKP